MSTTKTSTKNTSKKQVEKITCDIKKLLELATIENVKSILNNEDIFKQSGIDCFKEMSKAYKIPKAKEYNIKRLENYLDNYTGKYVCSARPILDYNKKYEK